MAPGIGVSARDAEPTYSSERLTNSAEPLSKPTRTIRGLRPDPGWWLRKPYGIGQPPGVARSEGKSVDDNRPRAG
jgi:hypothetical protein